MLLHIFISLFVRANGSPVQVKYMPLKSDEVDNQRQSA